MLISGRVWRAGPVWLAKSDVVDVCTEGASKNDALAALAAAFETLIDDPEIEISVEEVEGTDGVLIGSNKPAVLATFVLERVGLRTGVPPPWRPRA
jgi:hypothetical protein